MKYFDANVLVHYFVNFDVEKYTESKWLVNDSINNGTFYLTLLCVQETTFAMAKLQQPLADINQAVKMMLSYNPIGYELPDINRGCELAQYLGFKNINDCLHTAMAETHDCTELITYNRKDFVRIQPLTSLTINML